MKSVPDFKSLMETAIECYRAGDLPGADRAFQEWIAARRIEYERAKIDFNEDACSFIALERVRVCLEHAEDAFQEFHDLVEIIEGAKNAKRTPPETRN